MAPTKARRVGPGGGGGGACHLVPYIYSHSHSHNHLSCRLLELRASRTDRWSLPCSIPWVPGLPEVAHSITEDPEDWGCRPARLWGQWQLQSFSISNGDGRWPVGPPEVKGQGRAMQQRSNKQKARAPPTGAMQQPSYKGARMRRSKNGPLFGIHFRHPWDAHRL